MHFGQHLRLQAAGDGVGTYQAHCPGAMTGHGDTANPGATPAASRRTACSTVPAMCTYRQVTRS
jgi:hypothetical protein